MNERIKELYIETSNETADGKEWAIGGMKNAEKFAELIVKECAQVANLTEDYDTDDYKSGRQWSAFDIKNHFGVE